MAYSTSAPPILLTQGIAGLRIWYHTAADATGDVDADGYISNGGNLGMKAGDIVYHKDSTTAATAISSHKVDSVSTTYPYAVNLSAGTVIGSATTGD